MSAGFAGQHVVGFEDLNIETLLEVQNNRYTKVVNKRLCCSWASFLVKTNNFQGNEPKPKKNPGSLTSTQENGLL